MKCFAGLLVYSLLLEALAALHPHHLNTTHTHHLVRQDGTRKRDKQEVEQENSSSSPAAPAQKIPSILHYIYLKGFDAYMEDGSKPNTMLPKERFEFCQSVHRHWDSMFWDEATGRELIKEHYPGFLPVWEGYDMEAKKSDALRAIIMNHYGGLYLDLDVECYRAADDSFKQYDVVFQGTGDEGINNAVMASIPGHPVWKAYMRILEERSTQGKDAVTKSAMFMTGTLALSKTLFTFLVSPKRPVSGYLGGEFESENKTLVKIYPIGEWYIPCYGLDLICIKHFEREKESGEYDMSALYGRHFFAEITQPASIEERLKPHNVTRRVLL